MVSSEQAIGILTTDAHLFVRTWDDWLARVTGIAADAARGQPLSQLVPDLVTRGWQARLEMALREGSVQVMAPAFHQYLIPCAPVHPARYYPRMQQRVTAAPLREGGKVVGLMITIEDVTPRRERERELAEQLNAADESVRLHAAEALAAEEDGTSAQVLISALGDESWRVRRVAVNQLAHKGGPEAVAELVRALQQEHQDVGVLNSALQVLAMSGLEVLTPLVEFLNGSDPDLRIYAALALGEQRDERAISPLLRVLETASADPNLAYHSIEALGKLKATAAAPVLTSIARAGDSYLAFPALEALLLIGAGQAVPEITPLLGDEYLCVPAARFLGELGDQGSVAPLAAVLNREGAPGAAIAQALARLYDRQVAQYGNGETVVELTRKTVAPHGTKNLLDALGGAEGQALRAVAMVLGWLQADAQAGQVHAALTRLLGEPSARQEVVEALVRHGARVVELLMEQLRAEDLETRQAAAIALGRIGDARAVPALVEVLETDPDASMVAAGALAKIGDRQAFEPLMKLLGHPHAAVRQAAISALNSLGHPGMPARMAELMHSPDTHERESAARIVGYFGYEELVDPLIEMAHDPDEGVRRAVMEAIACLEDARVPDILFQALHTETPGVRAAAARALAHLETREAQENLVLATRDPDLWVRYFAARALSAHAGTATVDTLAALAQNDPAEPVRMAAVETLGAIGGPEARQALVSMSDAGDSEIAHAAAKALKQVDASHKLE